jgi:hypothetical protein
MFKTKSVLALLAVAVAFAVSTPSRADDPAPAPMPKEFEVVLFRPMAPGDIYEVEEKKTINLTALKITAETKTEAKEPRSLELTGTMVVAAADAGGQATEFTIKVKNFSGMGGKDETRRQYVPEGTEIIVKRNDKDVAFSIPAPAVGDVAKIELSEDAKIALSALYSKINPSNITDDHIFPSKTPRKINERWEADMAAIAAQAGGDGVKIDPRASLGSATLLNARKTDTGINITVQTKIEASIVSAGNVKLTDSWMKAKNVLILPLDPKSKSYKQELEQTLEYKASGTENGKPITQARIVYIAHSQNIVQVKK